jgi:hypothetical protein
MATVIKQTTSEEITNKIHDLQDERKRLRLLEKERTKKALPTLPPVGAEVLISTTYGTKYLRGKRATVVQANRTSCWLAVPGEAHHFWVRAQYFTAVPRAQESAAE